MRKPHVLKGNKTTQAPYNFIHFDCETIPTPVSDTRVEQVWRLAVAWYVTYESKGARGVIQSERFKDYTALWEWIASKATSNRRLYVVAHNAEFDFRVSKGFELLPKLGYTMVKGLYDSTMFTLFWRKGRSTIVVINSYQWLPVSIEALGDMMGMPKMPMPPFDAPDDVWWPYCERDVEILARAVDSYRRMVLDNDLGTFSLTIASQAFNAFRHKFEHSDIYIHTNEGALELERNAYYGGRVECFRVGTYKGETFFKLDVNSMYPSVMREQAYPVKLLSLRGKMPVEELFSLALQHYVIAECGINTTRPFYPKRFEGRLCFPIGCFVATLHQSELLTALAHGDVSRVYNVAVYARGDLFSSYVNSLYGMRCRYNEEGNAVFAYIVKLFLNSLYGKFGQRGRTSSIVGHDKAGVCWVREAIDAKTRNPIIYRCINGTIWKEEREGEAYHSFPAIAGAVTSYGRSQLLTLILKAGWENVYYIDTDSLIVNATGYGNLLDRISDTELGYLKVEAKADVMTLMGLKRYTFGEEVKNKGIKRGARQIAPNVYQVEKWRHIRSALQEGDLSRYYVDTVTIELQGLYTKGVVMPDGLVRPLLLRE